MILALGILSIVSMSCYTGLVIYAAFHDCDPVTTKVCSELKTQLCNNTQMTYLLL